MKAHRFNWKLLIILLIGLTVLAATAFVLNKWQKSRMAAGRLASGTKAYAQGQWEQAAADLGKYIAVAGGADTPVLMKYADAQLNIRPMKRDNVQQAVSTYRGILRLEPDNIEAATRLIRLYLDMGMDSESELIARRQLERVPNANLQRMLAMALVGQRKFKDAVAQLDAVIKSHPDDILAYEAMSRLCEQRPQECGHGARYWLDEAVRQNPSSAMAYIVRGAFEFRQKRADAAMADFERAQKLNLSKSDVRLRLARELIAAGQLSLAREHLAAVQSVRPKDLLLWQTWAMLAEKSGVKSEMVKTAQAGLAELAPLTMDFMPTATELFIEGGDYDAATKCIEKLHQWEFSPASVAFFRGVLAERQGQWYQAVKYCREAQLFGNKDAKVRMILAELLTKLDDEQSAIQQMRAMVSEQPDSEVARTYLAKLLLHSGRADEAAQVAMMVLQDSPYNEEAKKVYIRSKIQVLNASRGEMTQKRQIEAKIRELETTSTDKAATNQIRFQFDLQCADFAKASQSLAELKKIAPDDLETAIAESDLLWAQSLADQAQAKMKEMLEKFPDSAAAVRYVAMSLDTAGLHNECCSVLIAARDRVKDAAARRQIELLLAQQLRLTGKPDEARQTLNMLDKRFENDIAVKRELLKVEAVANDAIRAQRLIDDIKNFEGPQGDQWRYEQARLWFKSDEFNQRVSEIVSLLTDNLYANPDNRESRLLLAMTYEKAGQQRQAIAVYREAMIRSPYDVQVLISAVAAMYKAGDYDEADKLIGAATSRNISHPILSGYELQSCLRQGQLGSAAEILSGLRTADPNNVALDLYLAVIEMRRNNFDTAARRLIAIKARQPDSLAVVTAMVELNIRQKMPAEAIALCDEAVQKNKSAQAYILRGRTNDMLDEIKSAQRDFERAAQMEPNNGQIWAAKAQFNTFRGQYQEAAAAWERGVTLCPDNDQIREEALTFFLTGEDKELNRRGRKILDDALAAHQQGPRLQIWQARVLLREKTAPAFDQAIDILVKAAAASPSDVNGWSLLCDAWLQKNDPAKALDAVLRGLAYAPDNKTLLLLKARAEAVHVPELAIPTVRLLHEHDPNDADIAVYLAGLYVHGSNYKAAISVLDDQLTRGDPASQRKINIARAVALHKSGDKSSAHALFASLTKEDPNDTAVMLAEADLFVDEQRWDELVEYADRWYRTHANSANAVVSAVSALSLNTNTPDGKAAEKILHAAIAIDQNVPQLIGELARRLYVSDRVDEAMALYQRLVDMDPANLEAINNCAWIMCENQRNYAQALELAQKGLAISPEYLDLIDTRGVAYFRLGKFDKAIDDFTACAKLYPGHLPSATSSYFHLGRVYAALARKNDAVKYLKMALESNQKNGGLSAADASEAQTLLDGF